MSCSHAQFVLVRKVKPEGVKAREAIGVAAAEEGVEDAELSGDLVGPSEEHVGDYAERLVERATGDDQVGDEVSEVGFERERGFNKAGDEMVGKDVGVLNAGREAMAGAAEGDFENTNNIIVIVGRER